MEIIVSEPTEPLPCRLFLGCVGCRSVHSASDRVTHLILYHLVSQCHGSGLCWAGGGPGRVPALKELAMSLPS